MNTFSHYNFAQIFIHAVRYPSVSVWMNIKSISRNRISKFSESYDPLVILILKVIRYLNDVSCDLVQGSAIMDVISAIERIWPNHAYPLTWAEMWGGPEIW